MLGCAIKVFIQRPYELILTYKMLSALINYHFLLCRRQLRQRQITCVSVNPTYPHFVCLPQSVLTIFEQALFESDCAPCRF
jgi:hypothetical protein